jgi:hypothetical protein
METVKLYQWMEDSSLLTSETLPELEQFVKDYPYFSTARMLYLKNLALLNDVRFGVELKKTSVYVSDRKMLYMLIQEIRLMVETDIARQPQEKEDTFGLIDSFLSMHSELGNTPSDTSVLFPSVSSDYFIWKIAKEPEDGEEESTPKLQHQELIDSFIKEEEERTSAIRWTENDENKNLSLENTASMNRKMGEVNASDDSYFTETLAKIYIKQKRFVKALEIIQNLSLKYPEKNLYFADQIRFLEKLIINAKK